MAIKYKVFYTGFHGYQCLEIDPKDKKLEVEWEDALSTWTQGYDSVIRIPGEGVTAWLNLAHVISVERIVVVEPSHKKESGESVE